MYASVNVALVIPSVFRVSVVSVQFGDLKLKMEHFKSQPLKNRTKLWNIRQWLVRTENNEDARGVTMVTEVHLEQQTSSSCVVEA